MRCVKGGILAWARISGLAALAAVFAFGPLPVKANDYGDSYVSASDQYYADGPSELEASRLPRNLYWRPASHRIRFAQDESVVNEGIPGPPPTEGSNYDPTPAYSSPSSGGGALWPPASR